MGAARTALAIVISWLAAGALVVGIAWVASTLEPKGQLPADTLPYAVTWCGLAVAALVTSIGSLFAHSRRRAPLLGAAVALTLAMVAPVAVQI